MMMILLLLLLAGLSPSSLAEPDGNVLALTDENFDDVVAKGPLMVDIYATWCSHCRQLEPVWNSLAKELASHGIRVAKINGPENRVLMGRFGVQAFPSIYLMKDGSTWEYQGARTVPALKDFAINGHKKDSSLPFWQAPNSFLGVVFGHVHRLPSLSKDMYVSLKDEYGLSDMSIVLWCLTLPVVVGGAVIFLVDMLYLRSARMADEDDEHAEHED